MAPQQLIDNGTDDLNLKDDIFECLNGEVEDEEAILKDRIDDLKRQHNLPVKEEESDEEGIRQRFRGLMGDATSNDADDAIEDDCDNYVPVDSYQNPNKSFEESCDEAKKNSKIDHSNWQRKALKLSNRLKKIKRNKIKRNALDKEHRRRRRRRRSWKDWN